MLSLLAISIYFCLLSAITSWPFISLPGKKNGAPQFVVLGIRSLAAVTLSRRSDFLGIVASNFLIQSLSPRRSASSTSGLTDFVAFEKYGIIAVSFICE